MKQRHKSLLALFLIWTFFLTGLPPVKAQDIAPSEDLSLGSSVFVFRSSGKAAQRKFASRASSKVKRSKTQRIASTKKIRRQYETLPKVTTRRKRIKIVAPEVLITQTKQTKNPKTGKNTTTAKTTSVAFAGTGQYYYDKGEFDESIKFFREAVKLDAKNQDAKLGLSDALASKGGELLETDDKIAAKGFFEEAIKLNDKNSIAFSGLGEVYDSLAGSAENVGNAVKNYEMALSLDKDLTEIYAPLGVLYYQQGDFAKADDYLTKALAIDKTDVATNYFYGLVRYRQERFQDAAASFNDAIRLGANSTDKSDLAETRYYLGESYDKLGRKNEAVAEYKLAVQLNPKYSEAWFDLGAAHYNNGNYLEAITAYKEVVRLQNTNGEAHANLADAYRQLKRYGEANGEYSIAATFIKDDAELYSNWAFCLGKVQKWNNSIVQLNEAIRINPDPLDYSNLGWAYYNAAQADLKSKQQPEAKIKLEQGKTALQKATSLNSNLAPAFLNLGITLTDLGEYQESVIALRRANDLRKNWLFAVNELGIAFRKLGDLASAVEQFRRATEIDSKYDIGFYNLGEAELRRGNVKEAKKAMDKLKKLNRNLGNALEVVIISGGNIKAPIKNKIENKIRSKLPF